MVELHSLEGQSCETRAMVGESVSQNCPVGSDFDQGLRGLAGKAEAANHRLWRSILATTAIT